MDRSWRAERRVLVVDDDAGLRSLLDRYLSLDGYSVEVVGDPRAAMAAMAARPPDIVILDIMLPERDGFEVLSELRQTTDVPVIMLTARADEAHRVLGLRMGADDYVVKPFSPEELKARVASVLRRGQKLAPRQSGSTLDFGQLSIDMSAREVLMDGTAVQLTAREFDVLAFLAASPRQVFTRQQLLEHIWDSSAEWQDEATVTEHIRRVRHKIEPKEGVRRWLRTVRGVGYCFEP